MSILKKSTNLKLLVMSIAVFLIAAGHADADFTGKLKYGEDSYKLAKDMISDVFRVYRSYSRAAFNNIVDEDFVPDGMDFINGVERSSYNSVFVNIDYWVNSSMVRGDKLSTEFVWDKKVMSRGNSSQVKTSGKTTFVFKNSDSKWRLYQVKGDNPF